MMSEPLFDSNSDKTKLSDNLCFSSVEVDQLVKHRVDRAAIQSETYCIELLSRVTLQGDQAAWKIVQELLGETMRRWISQHPKREEACSLESEEHYMTQAFARFYLLIIRQQIDLCRWEHPSRKHK